MWVVFEQELKAFFHSIVAHVFALVFLLGSGLVLWFFPSSNVLAYGYADMGAFFSFAPYAFLLLVPALTMRSFSEEYRQGTMELLFTSATKLSAIVWGKYLAVVTLLGLCLLPSLSYYIGLYYLAQPIGNVDHAHIWGAYIGLWLLGTSFAAVGICCSAWFSHQGVAFILTSGICFILYIGIGALLSLDTPLSSWSSDWARELSLLEHYKALSQGVIASWEVVFFIGFAAIWVLLAYAYLKATRQSARRGGWKENVWIEAFWRMGVVGIGLQIGMMWLSYGHVRWDMTEEKRFSLSNASREILARLEAPLLIEFYLHGELPAGFDRLRKEALFFLETMSRYSDKIQVRIMKPSDAKGKALNRYIQSMARLGVEPTHLNYTSPAGVHTQRWIFPGVAFYYQGKQQGITFLRGKGRESAEEKLNSAIEGLEYRLMKGISKMLQPKKRAIGIVDKNILSEAMINSVRLALGEEYTLWDIPLTKPVNPQRYPVLWILPREAPDKNSYSETEKYYIDQYVMHGGKVFFFLNGVHVPMDSLSEEGTMAIPYETGLEDLLFRYGVRIKRQLIEDVYCARYPVVVGQIGKDPQIELLPWPFFLTSYERGDHPIARHLEGILMRFCSPIDTVEALGIKKTPLLLSSPQTRMVNYPNQIGLNTLQRRGQDEKDFPQPQQTLAILLQGRFASLYENRPPPQGVVPLPNDPSYTPKETEIILISTPYFLHSDIDPRSQNMLPLGVYWPENQRYGNADFLHAALEHAFDPHGVIISRKKQVQMRPLNKSRANKPYVRWLYTLLPMGIWMMAGVLLYSYRIYQYRRK